MIKHLGIFELSKTDLLIALGVLGYVIGKSKYPLISQKISDAVKNSNNPTANTAGIRKKVASEITSIKDDIGKY